MVATVIATLKSSAIILSGILIQSGGAAPPSGPTIVQTCTSAVDVDSGTCDFTSNVTSGNTIICLTSMEGATTGLASNVTGGGLTWTTRCDYDTAGNTKANSEIVTAPATSTAAVDPTYNWTNGSASFHSSIVCVEVSGAGTPAGFTADVDNDNPQQESWTTANNNSRVFGVLADWNATTGTQVYTSSPALTEIFDDEADANYSAWYYRSTDPIATAGTYSFGLASGISSTNVGHCAVEVPPA